MNIIWACVFIVFGKVTVIEVAPTRDWCEAISKDYPGSICHPVNVHAKYDVKKQIEAINELIK